MHCWDVFLKPARSDLANWITVRQWVGTIDAESQDQAERSAASLYSKPGYDLLVQQAPQQKRPDFNLTNALARYRELEGLPNLEIINNPVWQARRAQGDTHFLLDSRYFQEQEQLAREIEANGYTILELEDEEENPIYEIEPLEQSSQPEGEE
jgi:hypothetical protein